MNNFNTVMEQKLIKPKSESNKEEKRRRDSI